LPYEAQKIVSLQAMAENIIIQGTSKIERYESLVPQIKALIEGETDLIANLANIASAIKYGMDFFWVGFYLVKNNELVLGPFQGPVACTRIAKGKGVCGKSWQNAASIIVEDVDQFPGHIACSSLSKSEIVIPLLNDQKEVILVLDVDHDEYATFDTTDEKYLKAILALLPLS
jgi:L-methionine (R)-S-oxide reductase